MAPDFGTGFNTGFDTFEIMFTIVFVMIIGTFIVMAVSGITRWNKNNHSPRLTVYAVVVSKRIDVSHHHHTAGNDAMHTTSSTTYYVTFEVESGDRMEFHVDGSEYGILVEGDKGRLSFQGTRYLSFERS